MDITNTLLVSGAVGTGGAAFVVMLIRLVPRIFNGRPDPRKQPVLRGEIEDKYMRIDVCAMSREALGKSVEDVRRDVRLLIRHFGIAHPDGDEDE